MAKQNVFNLVYVVSVHFFRKKIVLCLPDAFMWIQGIVLDEAKSLSFPLPLTAIAHQQFIHGISIDKFLIDTLQLHQMLNYRNKYFFNFETDLISY